LKALSGWCLLAMRSFDVFGRLGGEEFAAMLPRTESEGALEVAERLRQAIEAASIELDDGQRLNFTISIGVATLPIEAAKGKNAFDMLMVQADQALYQAKVGGRNRVCVGPNIPPLHCGT
jgi:diguanylate cyclase (GGDEF)-like protein